MASQKVRLGEALGALSVSLALAFGMPVLLPTDTHGHHYWPWWAVLGEVAALAFLLLAIWFGFDERLKAVWARSPYIVQAPVVRRNRIEREVQAPSELGLVDHEILMAKASEASVKILGEIANETNNNTQKIEQTALRLASLGEASAERRKRALSSGARVIRKHARNLTGLEKKYRVASDGMVTSARRLIELTPADQDLQPLVPLTLELRNQAVYGRDSQVKYRATVQQTRDLRVSQDVNGACEQLVGVLDRIVEDIEGVIAYCDWVAEHVAGRTGTQSDDSSSGSD